MLIISVNALCVYQTIDGVVVAYGEGIAAVLLNSGLAEIVVVTLPKVAGGDEKALCGILRVTMRRGWCGLVSC